jgi:glycerophosphoryl diester phosphodiesterase
MLRLLLMVVLAATPAFAAPYPGVLVIAHRGASGERPEHTLAAYTLAIEQGADFIEPDLVMTKDGVLVARHENEISGTTDVGLRPEFARRKAIKIIDGRTVTGWFSEDFTLAELRTLKARERLPQLRFANTRYDRQFAVPTFEEILALLDAHRAKTGKRVGVYPEIKHGSYFDGLKLGMEAPLLAALTKHGYTKKTDPAFIQSFEVGNLQRLRKATKLRLVQLMEASGGPADKPGTTYASMATPAGLKGIAAYADAIGVDKAMIVPRDATTERSLSATSLVADARKARLKVHAWTFRAENTFLPAELRQGPDAAARGNIAAELRQFYALGVDGVFSDFPADAVAARLK